MGFESSSQTQPSPLQSYSSFLWTLPFFLWKYEPNPLSFQMLCWGVWQPKDWVSLLCCHYSWVLIRYYFILFPVSLVHFGKVIFLLVVTTLNSVWCLCGANQTICNFPEFLPVSSTSQIKFFLRMHRPNGHRFILPVNHTCTILNSEARKMNTFAASCSVIQHWWQLDTSCALCKSASYTFIVILLISFNLKHLISRLSIVHFQAID